MPSAAFGRWLNRSLAVKLGVLLALCASVSAAFVMAGMLVLAWWAADAQALDEARLQARTMALALQTPVAQLDENSLRDAMAVLKSHPRVQGAWVYDSAGGLLYAWGEMAPPPPGLVRGGLSQGWLELSAPIGAGVDTEAVGAVAVHIDLADALGLLRRQVLAAVAGTLAALGLTLVISRRLARRISVPVVQLAETASAIARDQRYERRLPPAGDDEVGVAVAAFNGMIDEVQRRGDALGALNTELQRRASESQAARTLAEAASGAKTRFLANMSHELRTPLNAVIGAAQLLAAEGGDAESRSHLVEAIQKSGISLLGLIENILDLSRIESGELRLEASDFHLLDCADAALATVSVAARAKGLTMACIVDPDLPAWRHGDALRLRQVLLNLLGNAVKFTPAGEVVLRLQRGAGDELLQLSVSDTGVGIGESSLQRIFEPFRQADDGADRRFGGSGLGLSIVRQLVQAMGGQIAVHSRLGQGTRFDVSLPLAVADAGLTPAPPLGVPIAYFEPHEASAQGLAAQLQRLGCPAQRVQSSAELRQWLAERSPQAPLPWLLVACDDGQAWGLLEDSADELDPERVIGMTRAEMADIELARETWRLPRNIIKPVLRSALTSRLGVRRRGTTLDPVTVPSALMTADEAKALKHVLVVEDDPLNQTIVCQMLSHAGHVSTAANDGAQALALLCEQRFDLALMDWQMPDMDGLEVTRRIRAGRAGEAAQRMPIVALTANAFAEDRAACLAAGMNDYLTKPVLADRLLGAVARWTGQTAAISPPVPPPSSPSSWPSPASAEPRPEAMDDPAVYDPSVLGALPMVADRSDPGYADELLAMFVQAARQVLADIGTDAACGDAVALQRRVHTLKSSAAQVGALALSAEAGRLESALRRGGAIDPVGAAGLSRRMRSFEQALAASGHGILPTNPSRSESC